jgi:ABC-2 type transport system ATP-binding protein
MLDEPTTGLDPQARHILWDRLFRLKEQGVTLVITTHYMDEAEQLCSQVAVVDHGTTIATGSPRDLIRSHGGDHRIEAQFSGTSPELNAFLSLPGAVSARLDADQLWCGTESPHATLPALLKLLEVHGCTLLGLGTRAATLEDVFVNLTGRHLREESMR